MKFYTTTERERRRLVSQNVNREIDDCVIVATDRQNTTLSLFLIPLLLLPAGNIRTASKRAINLVIIKKKKLVVNEPDGSDDLAWRAVEQ